MFTAAIEILDARFKELVHGNVHLDKLYTGCRSAEGPAYFPAGRYLHLVGHPERPHPSL